MTTSGEGEFATGGPRSSGLSSGGAQVTPSLAAALTANATGELTPEAIRATDWDRYVGEITDALSGNRNQEIVGSDRARELLAELDDLIVRLRTTDDVLEVTVQKVVALRRAVSEAAGSPVE